MRKTLVANRGEIACRVMRSCRALGLSTVAVYSEADKGSMHVEMADEARCIGAANPRDSYLNAEKILAAALDSGADSVHPGYGFLAENAEFAAATREAGLIWIGPEPQSIREMGDKERARCLARSIGAPILPGSERLAADDERGLAEAAARAGYPLLIKASAGGGGIGMRMVESPERLFEFAASTATLAKRAFGNADIFMERFLPNARHIEVQVFGLGDGRAVHFFERECSIQRRFQKIIEESPSPGVDAETRERMCEVAVALACARRYAGAGTVEFILDDDSGEFFFLEMNTRIQVEHPVTEAVCGVDLVALQLRLAAGDLRDLPQESVAVAGHAIECRLCAEDPQKMFLPSPGELLEFEFPAGVENMRVDTGFRAGDKITPYYDSLLAKIIAHGKDRKAAVAAMTDALAGVRLRGPTTNLQFLRNSVAHPAFHAGETTTRFVDLHKSDLTKSN